MIAAKVPGAGLPAAHYMKLCPRFNRCSVNRCPLDPLMSLRPEHASDRQKTCREHPRTRIQIAERARQEGVLIPSRGLTRLTKTTSAAPPSPSPVSRSNRVASAAIRWIVL